MSEERQLKIIFNKSGGTSTGVTTRLTIPSAWIKQMDITSENREVSVSFDGEQITIKKSGQK